MSVSNAITLVHVKKLTHNIDEIRTRSLKNIISKIDLGFGCDDDVVKKELLLKLFHWFSFPRVPHIAEVFDLLHRLAKDNNNNYVNTYGVSRFKNELNRLRETLDPEWHDRINEIEEVILKSRNGSEYINTWHMLNDQIVSNATVLDKDDKQFTMGPNNERHMLSNNPPSISETFRREEISVFKSTEGGIKWLAMPWQPLVTSDKAVLAAVEEALRNTADTSLILHTCKFVTNVMLQDFPAEVFLQRPAIVSVLHMLIEMNENQTDSSFQNVVLTVLETLEKLTRCLRFRIYYYCDPCVANKKQKLLGEKLDTSNFPSTARDSPDSGILEANYQVYQSAAASSDKSHSIMGYEDEDLLRLQQMFIPSYCIETLKRIIPHTCALTDSVFSLKSIKHVTALAHELIQLIILSIMPDIWLCDDNVARKISDELKLLLNLLGDSLEYLQIYSDVAHGRVMYIHLLCITMNLLSDTVPFELSNVVLSKSIKNSIYVALMDAPIYLLYPKLHSALQEYAQYMYDTNELGTIKLHEKSKTIVQYLQAAIHLTKDHNEEINSETLKNLWAAKIGLQYYKNMDIVKKIVKFVRNSNRLTLTNDELALLKKLILELLANANPDVQRTMYTECHALVKSIVGLEYNDGRFSWKNLIFLLESNVFTEIICHGTTSENQQIKEMAEEILVYILKGKMQVEEAGWTRILEAITPTLPLLHCYAHTSTVLGRSVTKMLDPDVAVSIRLPYLEVLKGNIRLLYSPEQDIRKEAVCRLIWLLGREKHAARKLPRLSSLQDLPLSSLFILERQNVPLKLPECSYQRNKLLSVLEILKEKDADPKMRKSALLQISIMLSDASLLKFFLEQTGLALVLDIFKSALIEDDYSNYPDSVIPILLILKLIVFTDRTVRQELSTRIDIFSNILRSLFLFPTVECVKVDAACTLCLLLYNDYVMVDQYTENSRHLNISLPHLVVNNMKLPFACKSYWKTSVHRNSDESIIRNSTDEATLSFIRLCWIWERNDGWQVLWKRFIDLNDDHYIPTNLMIQEHEFLILKYSSIFYCCQQQLYNIQSSTTHIGVSNALDFLTIYLRLYKMLRPEESQDISTLPWEETFERFLSSHPSSKEDCILFVDVINFLYDYVSIVKDNNLWIMKKIMRNMSKSLTGLFQNFEVDNQDIPRGILKLARTCLATQRNEELSEESSDAKEIWVRFTELVVSTLCFGNQQHFYNLAYLDWLLTCLTCFIGKCDWSGRTNLLMSLGNTLIEMIVSFHGAGTVSFMGLSITKNSIICLNHLLHDMQRNLNKNTWKSFWYQTNHSLSWLPMLWQNRDPLVRASALQLLAGLINNLQCAVSQLVNATALAPNDLCYTLLRYILNREESCIVREHACIAFTSLLKNSSSTSFGHMNPLKSHLILLYVEQMNLYYEISVLCSNVYVLATLDSDVSDITTAGSTNISLLPRTISRLYNCYNNSQTAISAGNSEITEMDQDAPLIATPSLITATCTLLNNLIIVGQHDVVRQIYEHSIDKYLVGCFHGIPKMTENKKYAVYDCDTLEMYISICTVLSNCIIHSNEFAAIINLPADIIYLLFSFLNTSSHCPTGNSRFSYLCTKFKTEIYNLIAVLSLTEDQHFESIQGALELCDKDKAYTFICMAVKDVSATELRTSATACLTFLLAQEIEKETATRIMLDNAQYDSNDDFHEPESNVKKNTTKYTIGAELCAALLPLFVTYNYSQQKRGRKYVADRDLIGSALANLLCLSKEAKDVALKEHFPETALMILKELYVKLNLKPYELYKNQPEREDKTHPLLKDLNSMIVLLTNFMHGSLKVKETLTKHGLADLLHKLWCWIILNKDLLSSTLKLLATFTAKCTTASQSLLLTTTVPGAGLRKTPNTVALIHMLIQFIYKEIENAGQTTDSHKLHFAFHVLRNTVHVHECRVSISKSNLLQFFSKIHPITTKRMKPWQMVEAYCLEFLVDFTYYEEGQICVPKAIDSLDVLVHLAKCSSSTIKILAMSVLRNLAFNLTNRPRLLGSVDIMNLLHDTFKSGSLCEINIAASMLWSLVCNNQKGKLIARSAGFSQSIQETLGKLTLLKASGNIEQEHGVVKMLEYVMSLLSPMENKRDLDKER